MAAQISSCCAYIKCLLRLSSMRDSFSPTVTASLLSLLACNILVLLDSLYADVKLRRLDIDSRCRRKKMS